ncbi:MAG: hypothetical protein H7Y11_09290, partial [Armatimonadetes bacterium]|nr:hypothetical protein [Anaerolineae bacterium]
IANASNTQAVPSPFMARSSPVTTTAYRATPLYTGPGITYAESGVLLTGVVVTITERNTAGTWLYVESDTLAGWVLSGTLNLPPELHYSALPITALADADPTTVNSRSLATLYSAPILSAIDPAMLDVFALGQALGNGAQTITKIGDSLSASDSYLTPFSATEYALGPHDDLEATLLYYGASAGLPSAASRIGLSTLVVFDAMWATDARCDPGESPLLCEYRVKQPSIAFVLFGPNDVLSMDTATYSAQMAKIVDASLERGIIPVLSTFSADPAYEYWWIAVDFNLALVALAEEKRVPMMNVWAAARALPDYGLDDDRIHLKHSGFEALKFDTSHETWYGVSLQNLLTLRMLDALRQMLAPADV